MMNSDYEQILKAIGYKIRMKRLSKCLSLDALALMIDGAQSHLSKIERGKIDFNFSTIVRIAHALECSVVEFLPPELLQDHMQKPNSSS